MQEIVVRIDSALSVRRSDLPAGAEAQIRQRLTIANGEKERALRRGDRGAINLPDYFELWGASEDRLLMMRGFAAELRAGLAAMGCRVRWDDHTSAPPLPWDMLALMRVPMLRPDQNLAAFAIMQHRQGVLHAPTSGGKTITLLDCWRRSGLTGLVLVDRIGLARQWCDRAQTHLGVDASVIGEREWEESALTVATFQTVHRHLDGLVRDGWFRRWGFTIVDECHHTGSADTYRGVVSHVCSRYLVGATATPLDGDWMQPFLTASIGPIIHQTRAEELRRVGAVVKPLVHVVPTTFHWTPTGREAQLVDPRAIYRHIIASLEADEERQALVAETILDQPEECAQLVVCRRLAYLDAIRVHLTDFGYDPESIFMMRGEESGERRAEIAALADEGGCVILASVADEGVDIPRLDRLHLVWPQRKALTITQQIGRVLRRHDKKHEVVVHDYADLAQGVLRSQFFDRRRVYVAAGYAVEMPDVKRETNVRMKETE